MVSHIFTMEVHQKYTCSTKPQQTPPLPCETHPAQRSSITRVGVPDARNRILLWKVSGKRAKLRLLCKDYQARKEHRSTDDNATLSPLACFDVLRSRLIAMQEQHMRIYFSFHIDSNASLCNDAQADNNNKMYNDRSVVALIIVGRSP